MKKKKPSLKEARFAFEGIVAYWEGRMAKGDPLFDQWMVDALEAAQDGIAVLDRLQECGYKTGIRESGKRVAEIFHD